jgi:hypothetical protein
MYNEYSVILKCGKVITETVKAQTKDDFEDFLETIKEYETHEETHIFETEITKNCVCIYGVVHGEQEKNINKYDIFPPPIDTKLYYGKILLIKYNKKNNKLLNLSSKDFKKFIRTLHNGFDDIMSEDERSVDSSSTDLDGFIVSDSDERSESNNSYSSSSDESTQSVND